MRNYETIREVLGAIDTADGTGQLDLPGLPDESIQDYLDLLYMADLAVAIDDAPYTTLTDAGFELLRYSREPSLWGEHTGRHALGDDVATLSALLMAMRRAQGKAAGQHQ